MRFKAGTKTAKGRLLCHGWPHKEALAVTYGVLGTNTGMAPRRQAHVNVTLANVAIGLSIRRVTQTGSR